MAAFCRPIVGLQEPGRENFHRPQNAHRSQTFETVDKFQAALAPAHHHRRQLTVALQRPHYGTFRFRLVQAIAPVVLTDLGTLQIQQTVLRPAQHRTPRRKAN
jgi:hypothetical protein